MTQKPMRHILGRRFLLVLVSIFLVTYLSVALTVFDSIRNYLAGSIKDNLTQIANARLEKIQLEFSRHLVDVQAWAALEVMNDMVTGDIDGRIRRTLAELKRQYGLAGDIYAFDANGHLVASSQENLTGAGLEIPSAWRRLDSQPYFLDKHFNPLSRSDVVAFRVGIRASFNPNMQLGDLIVSYPWRAVEVQLTHRGAEWVILASGSDNIWYAEASLPSLDAAAVAVLRTGKDELALAQRDFLAGFAADSSLPPWRIVALEAKQNAMEPIWNAGVRMLLLGAIIAAPMTLLILWLTRRLVKPIALLTRTVGEITASADLSKRVPVDSEDELGVLAQAFNTMTAKLQATLQELEHLNKTLEHKVAERTEQLQAINGELHKAIEQLKAAQGQLVQQEKMASLGQLVAGVAHELNNPIGSIYANLPILEEYVQDLMGLIDCLQRCRLSDEERQGVNEKMEAMDFDFLRQDIDKLVASGKNAANRVKEIVGSLRNFSRLDEAELKDVLLEDGLDSSLALLHHQIKNRIQVIRHYRLQQPVSCYAGQINQVFMNLLGNAIQAIDGEGSITVATWREGDSAKVSVTDSGSGIAPENLSRIFDPFFTTKPVGQGTGLGLSITYGIMEKHRGQIEVSSEVGIGTTFTLSLPIKS